MRRLFCALACLAVFAAQQAYAGTLDPTYNFAYADVGGNTAGGSVDATGPVTSPDGVTDAYQANTGTLTVATSSDPNAIGTYSLAGSSPNFLTNNLVYPNADATYGTNGAPPAYVDNFGLLFAGTSNTGHSIEVNIYANGGGDYAFLVYDNTVGGYTVNQGGGGTFTLSPAAAVPEPTSLALLGLGACGLATRVLRRRQA